MHKYKFIHTSSTRRYSFILSLLSSSFHSEFRKEEPSTVWWCAWMCQKKAVYILWIAKDKNIHNYTPKSFASSCSADSPRSKFKHFHFAVFRRKRWKKKNIAQYVGGKRSNVICFLRFALLQELNSSVERVNSIFEHCFCALLQNFVIRLDFCLYFIFITTNDKCFHLFCSPSGVRLWGHIKYRA